MARRVSTTIACARARAALVNVASATCLSSQLRREDPGDECAACDRRRHDCLRVGREPGRLRHGSGTAGHSRRTALNIAGWRRWPPSVSVADSASAADSVAVADSVTVADSTARSERDHDHRSCVHMESRITAGIRTTGLRRRRTRRRSAPAPRRPPRRSC
jgi:hypothetical protein